MLIAMAGLPGSGKSTLARALARELRAVVMPVDAVEAALWRSGVGGPGHPDVPTGLAAYVVVHAMAAEALDGGLTVVVDAVNAVEPARAGWRDLAAEHGVPIRWLEVACGDADEHRRRLEARGTRYEGFTEPTWESVRTRVIDPWPHRVHVLDSSRPLAELVPEALAVLAAP